MDLEQFEAEFGTDRKCFDYLYKQRWPDEFRCTNQVCIDRNKDKRGSRATDSKMKCTYCKSQISIRVGSMFEGSRVPINKWFRAIWLIAIHENGTSGLWLQKKLGLGSYPTALKMLHEIREKMYQGKLQGTVYVDVLQKGSASGDGFEDDYIIAVEVEVKMKKVRFKKIRMCKTKYSEDDMVGFLERSVEQGSTIYIVNMNWGWEDELSDIGYTVNTWRRKEDNKLLPLVDKVVSYLKEYGLLGTPQGYCSDKYLDKYLDECCFKFNVRDPKKRFDILLQSCCRY